MPHLYSNTLQIIVAIGLLNVWLFRFNKPTSYRVGSAKNLKEEFQEYGLPVWFCYVVGVLKVSAAFALIAGVWLESVILPSAILIAFLMLAAVVMHIMIRDPFKKAVPALSLLIVAVAIVSLRLA